MSDETPRVGDRVVDRDDDEPDEGVVVNRPDATADEWNVGERTVATFPGNGQYDDTAAVAVVVFRDALAEAYPDYAGDEPLPVADLAAEGVPHYTFPAPRLRVVDHDDDGDEDEEEADPTPDLDQSTALVSLAERLTEGGGATVAWELDATATGDSHEPQTVLVVEKLGETYRIRPDGTVEGEGAVADRLAELAGSYVARTDEVDDDRAGADDADADADASVEVEQ